MVTEAVILPDIAFCVRRKQESQMGLEQHEVTKMTGSSNPRFRLMIGWCCLMSAALIIMTVILATKTGCHNEHNTNKTANRYKEHSSKENDTPLKDQMIGFLPGQSFKDYIRLISDSVGDSQKSWICSPTPLCDSSSFSLNNSSVEIKTSGLYYIHAQVGFDLSQRHNQVTKKPETITLVKNGKRKLSEVKRYEAGSVSMIRIVQLKEGDSIGLDIQVASMILSTEDSHTYWEILLLYHIY
ncbi:uncharacterized protein LOC127422324 [Myxocyprinus asiaticus]|uniref:uncharacterized protein LOC127422324 n=1 Tax=Myxocyprinus asiaticus TaxID=70543 RepID=UPI002222FF71|nr:uncharacterized protein LOC127422324 [Myxocyprinus asiaticus]